MRLALHRLVLPVFGILATASCASTQAVTAMYQERLVGITGCSDKSIQIRYTNPEPRRKCGGTDTFEAACEGRTFVCSSTSMTQPGMNQPLTSGACMVRVDCTEKGAATPASPVATEGCTYDTQCKGERICTAGQCVEPVVAPVAAPAVPAPPPPVQAPATPAPPPPG